EQEVVVPGAEIAIELVVREAVLVRDFRHERDSVLESTEGVVAAVVAVARKRRRARLAARWLIGELARVRRGADAVEIEPDVLPRVRIDFVLLVDRPEAHRLDGDEDGTDVAFAVGLRAIVTPRLAGREATAA